MKIKSIHIKNFQSHKDTLLEMHAGVNALVGLSDSGKSAVLRAINWVVNNRPSGDAFMSHWGGETHVKITFEDGTAVIRVKGNGTNEYRIKRPGHDKQVLTGFNQSVPEAVQQVLNIQDVNLRFQHQGAFLLCENAGEISRYLNRVARFEVIDQAISNIASINRAEKAALEAEKATDKRLFSELEAFAYLPEAEQALLQAEALEAQVQKGIASYNTLYDIVEEGRKVTTALAPFERLASARNQWAFANAQVAGMNVLANKQSTLLVLKAQIEESARKVEALKGVLAFNGSVTEYQSLNEELLSLGQKANTLDYLIKDFKVTTHKRDKAWRTLALEDQAHEAWQVNNEIASLKAKRRNVATLVGSIEMLVRSEIPAQQERASKLKNEYEALMPAACPLCGAVKEVAHDC